MYENYHGRLSQVSLGIKSARGFEHSRNSRTKDREVCTAFNIFCLGALKTPNFHAKSARKKDIRIRQTMSISSGVVGLKLVSCFKRFKNYL